MPLLWQDARIQTALTLGRLWGRPLFELVPQLIPYGHLSGIEIELWNRHYGELADRRGE